MAGGNAAIEVRERDAEHRVTEGSAAIQEKQVEGFPDICGGKKHDATDETPGNSRHFTNGESHDQIHLWSGRH